KVAVVTGAASGIGWGLAEHCAREGMKVVLADIEEAALKAAEETLKDNGADVLAIPTDVSKHSDIEALAKRSIDTYGGVHLLFNNAGVQAGASVRQPLWENTMADWEWVMGVNLWGVIYGIEVFLPIMLQQNTPCHVVNTSSMAGLIAEPQLVIYSVTKAGIIKLSEGLYLQLKRQNAPIGVSVLCPAFVSSRLGDAERNRPPALQNPPEAPQPLENLEQPSLIKQFQHTAAKVLSPEQSAEIVFRSIREDRFYIMTDPLVTMLFKQRAENILEGNNPEMPRIA
ncbi:MAG: SDR family NAD(P)-dependent oxidoreductase, partial [Dehalococcoidales bacterium]|nr:SDR family NAD(P)-dependent oxidoreductase [Dehalococcoidales bacterium]